MKLIKLKTIWTLDIDYLGDGVMIQVFSSKYKKECTKAASIYKVDKTSIQKRQVLTDKY